MPRIQLATLGIDPRKAFAEEVFTGSHDAAVRAVAERRGGRDRDVRARSTARGT